MEIKKNNLLIVDDNPDMQELTKDLFESEGYDVYCVSNGKEALEFLRTKLVRINLILLDLMMPVMDGYQFRREQLADAELLAIPVIITSADADIKAHAVELQAQGFLTKAGSIENMLEIVRQNCI